MSRNLTRVWPLLVVIFASEVWALGLGDIRLSSALNEPLSAKIELLSATPEELDNLTVVLASSETFARYGLDRPIFLQNISFRVVKSGAIEGNIITVVSQDSVTEPFVTFLVEATWSRGRLLREYTLLLDPPTFAPPPVQESATMVTAPQRAAQADSGRIERQPEPRPSSPPSRPLQPAPEAAPTRSEPPDPATFDATSGGDYYVQRGNTLWRIALDVRPDVRLTINQTMLAIFEANPEAFAGNINIMSAGVNLRIPSGDEFFRISRGVALSEVQRQHSEWGGVMSDTDTIQQTLVLVPPDDDQTGYDSGVDTAGADDADVDEDPTERRIRDIEDTLADHQNSLIEIQDDELAALRQELARLRGEEYIEPDLVDDDLHAVLDDEPTIDTQIDPDLVDDDLHAVLDDEPTIDTQIDPDLIDDDLAADDADADDIGVDDADTTAPAPIVVTSQTRDEPGIGERVIKFLTEGYWGLLIGAILVVLGILVWFARRAASDDDDESTGVWDALDADDLDGESLASTERLRALAREDDTAIVVVEQESVPTREPESDILTGDTIDVPASPQAAVAESIEMPIPPQEPVEDQDVLGATGENIAIEDTFSSETAINLDQSDPVAEADFHMAYGLYDQAADLINGALEVEPEREDLLAKLCEIYFVWGNQEAFIDAASRMRTVVGTESRPDWDKIVIMGQQIASDHELFSGVGPAPTREVDLSFEGADEGQALDMDLEADFGEGEVIDLGEEIDEAVSAPEDTGLTAEMPSAESDLADASGEIPAIDATGESPAVDETGDIPATDYSGITAQMPTIEDTGHTEEIPTAEAPLSATGETPTIEEQFRVLEETGELPALGEDEATRLASLDETGEMPSIDDADATRLASLDDEDDLRPDSTAEIELVDLGLDLGSLGETGLETDLDGTAEREALPVADDLDVTGTNESLDELDDLVATGKNPALETGTGTGFHQALDADDTGINVEIDTSLLDATGQTQILTGDLAVGTASEIEDVISAQDKTMLAPLDDEPTDGIPEDAATLLAPLDDDDEEATLPAAADEDFAFAKTEALPKDVFTGMDPLDESGERPGLAGTDMDLDLDDLTAALRVSDVGDTVDQVRDDATVEQPRPSGNDLDIDDTDDDDDLDPTARLAPEEVTGDLHDARTMTEVGTKLDLARAYVDMGDPSGARSILEEVLDDGDESQRQQAQQLLDSLPG